MCYEDKVEHKVEEEAIKRIGDIGHSQHLCIGNDSSSHDTCAEASVLLGYLQVIHWIYIYWDFSIQYSRTNKCGQLDKISKGSKM